MAAACKDETEKDPIDGVWKCEWIRNASDPYEHVPSLYNNMFIHDGLLINFSWFSRYNEVNMRFNFSGEDQPYRHGQHYDFKGDTVGVRMDGNDRFQRFWLKDTTQTALMNGPEVVEQFSRVEPDRGALRVLKALYTAGNAERSHPVCGVWKEVPDTLPDQPSYFMVNGDIYARFIIYIHRHDALEIGAGGWCGEARHEGDDQIFMLDRTAKITWHDKDSMTLHIPRDSDQIEDHTYVRSEFPEQFKKVLRAAETFI